MTKIELLASLAGVPDDEEVLTSDGLPIVGVLHIPDLGVYLVDEEGSDDADLKESVQAKGF